MSQYGLRSYRFHPADAAQVLARERYLQVVYRECFADPPWSEDEAQVASFPQRLAQQMAHPGAHGIIVERDGRVVAAIYGWPAGDTLPAGTAFDDALAAAAPRHVLAALTAPALVVAELMVHPAHRRKGIARALLTRYVSRWPRAWLCTHPQAPAVALYESMGWRRQFDFVVGEVPLVLYLWRADESGSSP
jgi:GNAT superfamily N-acetyltransferase